MNLKKKISRFFILVSLSLAAVYVLQGLEFRAQPPAKYEFYEIEFDYFGMDARQIEKTISKGLEEVLSLLENVHSIKIRETYSRCTADISFYKKEKPAWAALCSACNEFYRTLPSDVQAPRIYSSSQGQKYIFCAAFDGKKYSKDDIEKKLKPALLSIPGIADAVFSGGTKEEIQAAFNSNALLHYKIPYDKIAEAVQKNFSPGTLSNDVLYKKSLMTLEDFEKIYISGIPLTALAEVSVSPQKEEEKIRINGKEAVTLSIKTSDENKNIFISREVKKCLLKNFNKGEWNVIYDRGREQKKMALKIFLAFFQSVAALTLITFILEKSLKHALLLLAFTALDLLFSLALLSVTKTGIDSAIVSGFTISLGLICDNAFFVMELKKRAESEKDFIKKLRASFSTMLIATLTTVCVSIPLCSFEAFVPGIKNLSLSASLMILISFVLSASFLPYFLDFSGGRKTGLKKQAKIPKIPKILIKMYDFVDNYIIKNNTILKKVSIMAIPALLVFATFLLSEKNLSQTNDSEIIYAQIEYNPEKSYSAIDREVLPFCDKILKVKGVDFVRTECRRGVCLLDIVLKNAKDRGRVSEAVLRHKKDLTGFLYIPLLPKKQKAVQEMTVSVTGASHQMCRKIAGEAAALLSGEDFILKKGQVVLNFKGDETACSLVPDRLLLASEKSDTETAARIFRANVFGPVVKKVIFGGSETDIRLGNRNIAFNKDAEMADVFPLLSKGFSVEEEKIPSTLYRQNGKSAASFTVQAETDKSQKLFRLVQGRLKSLAVPPGYTFIFPEEFVRLSENYGRVFLAFATTVAALFLLIAAQCEEPLDALKVVWTIPLSLLLPLLLRFVLRRPLSPGDMTSLVFLSGLCVNNGLFILNEFNAQKRKSGLAAFRAVFQSIWISALTTAAGSLPVMFLSKGFGADLAFFMFWGTAGTVFSAAAFTALLQKR